MNEPLPEELLSAYLDGELPSDERSRVEQWLAECPEHRRFYDDLLALRREIQALPAQSLDAGFSDRVLATIRSRTAPAPQPPKLQELVSPAKPTLGIPAWRWFAAGVAATLAALLLGANLAPEAMTKIGLLPQPAVAPIDEVPKMAGPAKPSTVAMKDIAPTTQGNGVTRLGEGDIGPQATPVEKQPSVAEAKRRGEADVQVDQVNRANDRQLQKKQADEKASDLDSATRVEKFANAIREQSAAAAVPAAGLAAPGAAAPSGKADLAKGEMQQEGKKEGENLQSVKQWLDSAVARNDGAFLELDLALRSPAFDGAESFQYADSIRRSADREVLQKKKQTAEAERRLRADTKDDNGVASEVAEPTIEIKGSREEVEQLLAALGEAQVVDARFIAPPAAKIAARKAAAKIADADRLSNSAGRDAKPAAVADAATEPPLPPPAPALAANDANPETLRAFGGAGKSGTDKRIASSVARGAPAKPGELGDAAGGGFGAKKDAPRKLRVRLQLVP